MHCALGRLVALARAAPADAYDEADYEALEVLSASERTGPGETR